jgi:hypothetical protein
VIENYTTPLTQFRTTPDYDFSYILNDLKVKYPILNCAEKMRIRRAEEYTIGERAYDNGRHTHQQVHIKRNHNLDADKYFEMCARQYFSCAICLDRVSPYDYFAHVDHCKVTNTNCGILCRECNQFAMPIYERGWAPRGAEIMGIQFA